MVLVLSGDHKLKNWADMYIWGATALIAHLSLLPIAAIGVVISKKWQTWRFDIGCLLLMGVFRGIIINYCVDWFSLTQSVSNSYKIFNSMIALPIWFIGIGIFLESNKNYQKTYRDLFAQAIFNEEKTHKRGKNMPGFASASDEAIARLQFLSANLALEIQALLNRPRTLNDYSSQASAIQNLIDDGIRPATIKLQNASKVAAPKITPKILIQTIILEHRLPVPLVVFVSAPYLFVGLNGSLGTKIAVLQTCFISGLNLTVFLCAETVYKMKALNRFQANLFTIISGVFLSAVVQFYYRSENFAVSKDFLFIFLYQILLSTSFTLYLLTVNGYFIIKEKRQEVITNLENYIAGTLESDATIERKSSQSLLDASKYLHGEIQAGLTSSSILLRRAANLGDSRLAHEALSRASGLLSRDMTNIAFTRMANPKVKIEKIISAWKGIADISISMPHLNLLEDSVLRNAVQLVEEGILNSIRHAGSTEIKVVGVLKGEILTITLISNGAPMKKKRASLGIAMFNDLTEKWSYGTDEGKNILSFFLRNTP